MATEERPAHGMSGYRKGCRCETCRRAKREYMRDYRARQRRDADEVAEVVRETAALDPLAPVPSIDMKAAPGAVERALCEDLERLTGEPPWKRTLSRIAMLNARLLDQAPIVDRLDLISPIQLRTLEVLNRLRAVSAGSSVADDAAALLRDMAEESADAGTEG